MAQRNGYAGKILRVDLSSRKITALPTEYYAEKFIGGKGIAAKIYWDEVPPETGAFDPENRLIFMTGPMAGISPFGFGGASWKVCGKSPISTPAQFCHCNLGGTWGAYLKFAGYDGIVVQGEAGNPVYLFINDDEVELREASFLWGKDAVETREILKNDLGKEIRVVTCGPAGENRVIYANLLADEDASGAGGMGAVMGSKKLKAIAVRGTGKGRIKAADPERLKQLARYINDAVTAEEKLLVFQIDVPEDIVLPPPGPNMKKQVCYACKGHGCQRVSYRAEDGTTGKFMCQASVLYRKWAHRHSGSWDLEVPFHANRLCNAYGVDTMALSVVLEWIWECYEAGILTDEKAGFPLSKLGTLECLEALLRKISLRENFGDVLAQGVVYASQALGSESQALLTERLCYNELSLRTHEEVTVDPRLFPESGLFFAMDMRITKCHYAEILKLENGWLRWLKKDGDAYITSDVWRAAAKKFMGSEAAADFSTYDGKALSAKTIHEREAANGSMALCNYIWPIVAIKNSADHVGDSALESKVLSAVAGKEVSEAEYLKKGERIFNVERAIRVREGHRGRQSDVLPELYFTSPVTRVTHNIECLLPGKNGEVLSRKGAVLDRAQFEGLKSEYYQLRGWDVGTGLQTREGLVELGLPDIAEDLETRGLLGKAEQGPLKNAHCKEGVS